MTSTVALAVRGMHCASCALLVDETLEELAGVTQSTTHLPLERTEVRYDPTETDIAAIIAAVAKLGYVAQPA